MSAKHYTNYISQTYGLHGKPQPYSFKYHEWPGEAEKALSKNAYGYLCNAGADDSYSNNLESFRKWGLVPNRLADVEDPDISVQLFGKTYTTPVLLAPIGVQEIFHPGKEIASSTAAKKCDVTYITSTAAASSLEEIADAGARRWFQLYWPTSEMNDVTVSILDRASKSGYEVLVVTLDTYQLGWRPSDLNNGYNPFVDPDFIGTKIGLTDPVFCKIFKEKTGKTVEEDIQGAVKFWVSFVFHGYSHKWEELKFIKEHWKGPIVLKGIQAVHDAKMAVEYGIDGIVVSNHGGRQVDGSIASLQMLPEIADAVGDKLEILFDSGIRTGSDIAKALALGAKAVLLGRPYVYGLAFGGEEGCEHVIRCLLGDFASTMCLGGFNSVSDLNKDGIRRVM